MGATKTLAYDALQRHTRIEVRNSASQLLALKSYQYDLAGNITQIDSDLGSTQYGYDKLSRLTQASPDNNLKSLGLPQEQYGYDPVGNRIASAHQPGAWSYNADNQLTQYPRTTPFSAAAPADTSVSFTPQGHTAQEKSGAWQRDYRYNAAERLIETSQNGQTTSYRYDPLGRRISKTTGSGAASTTTYFLYSDTGLLAEADSQGNLTKAYGFNPKAAQQGLWSTDPMWQADVTGNSLTNGTTSYHYLHTDHLATPILGTDKTGATTWKGASEAFGATRATIQATEMNLRFPGQYWDRETNSHYNFQRDYQPGVGRYTQADPIGLKGGINFYVYVGQRPINRIDATGLFSSGADYALIGHFYGGSGGCFDISSWCKDYVADEQVKTAMNILENDIRIQNKKLLGLDGAVSYQIKNNKQLVISLFSIYSFGAGNGHMQDADCVATGDGCCVESKCSLKAKAFDRFTDQIDLCQRWGICGGIREVGGTPFNFELSCSSNFSVKDCKSDCCKN